MPALTRRRGSTSRRRAGRCCTTLNSRRPSTPGADRPLALGSSPGHFRGQRLYASGDTLTAVLARSRRESRASMPYPVTKARAKGTDVPLASSAAGIPEGLQNPPMMIPATPPNESRTTTRARPKLAVNGLRESRSKNITAPRTRSPSRPRRAPRRYVRDAGATPSCLGTASGCAARSCRCGCASPDPVAVAPVLAALAPLGAGVPHQRLDVNLHQPPGDMVDSLLQQIAIGPLLNQLRQCHPVVGHRSLSGWLKPRNSNPAGRTDAPPRGVQTQTSTPRPGTRPTAWTTGTLGVRIRGDSRA